MIPLKLLRTSTLVCGSTAPAKPRRTLRSLTAPLRVDPLAKSFDEHSWYQFIITMSAPHVARSITNTIRHVGRSRPRLFHTTVQRAALTKHPRGFVPPTTDDLAELRERVQEFTREPGRASLQMMASEAKYRTRNNRRGCSWNGSRKCLSFRHVEKIWGSRV